MEFQFHNGSIKSAEFAGTVACQDLFQFHNGSIKSKLTFISITR